MKERLGLDNLLKLKGKRAIVTGAAAGIGAAIAGRLAEAGADLVLVDVDYAGLQIVKRDLAKWGHKIEIFKLDLAQKTKIDEFWQKLEGAPDIIVNNAGIYPSRDMLEVDEAFYSKVMSINLHAAYWMCQQFIARRIKLGGTIVNIGSIEALLPFKDGMVHYDASKAGVIAMTRSIARDYAKKGIKANALLPGGILTPGAKKFSGGAAGALKLLKTGVLFNSRLPIGRIGDPDEIAKMALVLCSDLSSYMAGAAVVVDGGFLSA